VTNLVQTSENMGQVCDRIAVFVHLMEYVISEELDDIAIPGLRPTRVTSKPEGSVNLPIKQNKGNAYSGRSLINPNLHKSRTNLAFSNSLISSCSSRSTALRVAKLENYRSVRRLLTLRIHRLHHKDAVISSQKGPEQSNKHNISHSADSDRTFLFTL
jgi:hypothetical protein